MRMRISTLAGGYVFLLLCVSVTGQSAYNNPSSRAAEPKDSDDPIVILEVGAATSWNVSGGAAGVPGSFVPLDELV